MHFPQEIILPHRHIGNRFASLEIANYLKPNFPQILTTPAKNLLANCVPFNSIQIHRQTLTKSTPDWGGLTFFSAANRERERETEQSRQKRISKTFRKSFR